MKEDKEKTIVIKCPICKSDMNVSIYDEKNEITFNTDNCNHDEDKLMKKDLIETLMTEIKKEMKNK